MYVGADVNQDEAVLVLLEDDGELVVDDSLPPHVLPVEVADPGERLGELLERLTQHFRHRDINALVLTDSSVGRTKPSSVRSRAQIEAVLVIAARRCEIPVRVVHQKSVATHLGLPASSDKASVRAAVAAQLGKEDLKGHPERRARAIGAVWSVLRPGSG